MKNEYRLKTVFHGTFVWNSKRRKPLGGGQLVLIFSFEGEMPVLDPKPERRDPHQ